MSKNEEVALDANFTGWREKRFPAPPKDINVFEYYCIEQFLRPYDLSDSQHKTGLVGGTKDGGVDALYMLVNGELIDAESELDPKTSNTVKLLIMQVKEGEGFSPVAVDKLYWFADDLLDLTRKKAEYHSTYRPELITAMRLFKDKYGIIVGENPSLSVEFYYITKRDVEPNDDCKTSADKVKALVKKHFDLRPKGIVAMLDLLRPIYEKTAAYGHFGRDEPEFTWENLDKVEILKADAGLKQTAAA